MAWRSNQIDSRVSSLDSAVAALRATGTASSAIARWRADAAALRFHLRDSSSNAVPILAILGGTGTGKSTLVNRLLDANISAASFRRTFTSGAVAIVSEEKSLPRDWLGIDHTPVPTENLPARGQPDALLVVPHSHAITQHVTLVDTPDLDGDQPLHHAQADRAFRWAQAVLFLVTPEKYQMTELLPYYRLAKRYAIPALFVMNKCEEAAVLDDFVSQLNQRDWAGASVFAIPRDDAAYNPPPGQDLSALRDAIAKIERPAADVQQRGASARARDLLGRLSDQIIAPLRELRRAANDAIASLKALEAPTLGIDVNPLTQQLQRRLQQRSVLYLMGPRRMLDRVRQVPGMIARLPRTTWDLLSGKRVTGVANPTAATENDEDSRVPDFHVTLADQFRIVQSRIEDVLRSSPLGAQWLTERAATFNAVKFDPNDAGRIADEELAELKAWLEKRWNATPRDTAILMRLLKHLPGGDKLTQWSEAAPYLLALIVATHHVFFGHVDLMIIGGFSLFTWLTEKLSNEVASRTRQANRKIAERYGRMTHDQIQRVIQWLDEQAPQPKALDAIERAAGELQDQLAPDEANA